MCMCMLLLLFMFHVRHRVAEHGSHQTRVIAHVEKNQIFLLLRSEIGDTHTPVSDQGGCPPPPLALTAQDSVPQPIGDT